MLVTLHDWVDWICIGFWGGGLMVLAGMWTLQRRYQGYKFTREPKSQPIEQWTVKRKWSRQQLWLYSAVCVWSASIRGTFLLSTVMILMARQQILMTDKQERPVGKMILTFVRFQIEYFAIDFEVEFIHQYQQQVTGVWLPIFSLLFSDASRLVSTCFWQQEHRLLSVPSLVVGHHHQVTATIIHQLIITLDQFSTPFTSRLPRHPITLTPSRNNTLTLPVDHLNRPVTHHILINNLTTPITHQVIKISVVFWTFAKSCIRLRICAVHRMWE